MPKITNLTPHSLVVLIQDPAGEIEGTTGTGPAAEFFRFRKVAEIPPSGKVARASQQEEVVEFLPVNGEEIPVVRMVYGATTDLPAPEEGIYNYVSLLTAQAAAAQGRPTGDLLFSGKSVRDRGGRIIGLLSFGTL